VSKSVEDMPVKRKRRSWWRLLARVLLAGLSAAAQGGVSVDTLLAGHAHDSLFALAFDRDRGVAVGAAGLIYETADRGQTWKRALPAPTSLSVLGVDLKRSECLAVGQMGLILRRDGADAWKKVDSGTTERLFAVSVNSDGMAVAVGSFGTVLQSVNHGESWRSIAPENIAQYSTDQLAQPHLYAVVLNDQGVITVAGEYGLILRSSDGGVHWNAVHKGESSLFALDLHSDGPSYAVGQSGAIVRSIDAGATWNDVVSNSAANLLGVSASANGKVVVTAMHEILTSDDGERWHPLNWGDFGSAWYSGVHFVGTQSESAAVLVGHAGTILRLRP
jgi:photosystem II stability/assembly factor-like uncharacterized protein